MLVADRAAIQELVRKMRAERARVLAQAARPDEEAAWPATPAAASPTSARVVADP